ncbi:cytoplasmic protein [Piromyces finnis]|uniref:Cytoplasmic protein n=1 Tax=Piromyces finnis TaxID=1754191 RepID=A0A1Y1VQ57_9FUNG|nr:cytoplasmic protein [Piromyces finnis]|eukprot:ORX61011.1 cytoplasmic protein [Piromyces finnis]
MSEKKITLTIRLIKSFEYRTFKNVILHDVDITTMTCGKLKEDIIQKIHSTSGYKPYLNVKFDTLKLYFKHFGAKTSNLIVNLDHDDWFLDDSKTLEESGIENEAEISFFNRADYDKFKANPEIKW